MLARLSYAYRHSIFNPFWLDSRHLRRSITNLAPEARGLLLDVGVGERPYGALFAPHVSRYVGLEYPPSCENLSPGISGEHLADLRGAVDVWGDAHGLPFRESSFDTVLCLEMLEHVPDSDRCVAQIARVLRPGGRLLATVPFIAPLHAMPYDFGRMTAPGIAALLERHGLELVALTPRGNTASATGALLAQYLLRGPGRGAEARDGSVSLSRWRAPFVMPLVGLVQLLFLGLERLTRDTAACLGYTVIARRPT
ncbi:MAG: class I SAM-dependent methyltransferase [Planctomycetota bacterium]